MRIPSIVLLLAAMALPLFAEDPNVTRELKFALDKFDEVNLAEAQEAVKSIDAATFVEGSDAQYLKGTRTLIVDVFTAHDKLKKALKAEADAMKNASNLPRGQALIKIREAQEGRIAAKSDMLKKLQSGGQFTQSLYRAGYTDAGANFQKTLREVATSVDVKWFPPALAAGIPAPTKP
ncbi:MAG: hypothetical protein AAF585_05860, partial [Verrucomicrobiota bacterium]